jgi:hypothetical protein
MFLKIQSHISSLRNKVSENFQKSFVALTVVAVVLGGFFVAGSALAATWTVGSSEADFNTIQEAIDAAVGGDTINVAAGTYEVNASVDVNKSVIITTDASATIVSKTQSTPVFKISVDNVTIENFNITTDLSPHGVIGDEVNSSLVLVNGENIVITDNVIYADESSLGGMATWTARGIVIQTGSAEINGNTIYGVRNGIIGRYGVVLTVEDNIIFDTKGGIMNYTNSQADADGRTMSSNSWGTTHNEWDIVWNSGGGPYEPDYNQSVLVLSSANNDAYVVSLMSTTGTSSTLTGNRSHVFVNATTGTTTKHWANGNQNLPYKTIQLGIDAVVPGGTVNIAAGTYGENPVINKQLTLLGAHADIDPAGSTDRIGESIIQGGQVEITAAATFNGFKINGNRIYIHGAVDAVASYNIIVASTMHGIYIDGSSNNARALYNTVVNPDWQGIVNEGSSGVIISYNYVSGVTGQQPIESTSHAGTGIEITHNVIENCTGTKGINYWGGPGPDISYNTISGTDYEAIFSDTKTNRIVGNDISETGGPAIQLYPIEVADASEKSIINENTITLAKWQAIVVLGQAYTEISGNDLSHSNYYGADGTGDWDYATIHVQDGGGFTSDYSAITYNVIRDGINGIQVWSSSCDISNNDIADMGLTYGESKTVGENTYQNAAVIVGGIPSIGVSPDGTNIGDNILTGNTVGLFIHEMGTPGETAVSGNTFNSNITQFIDETEVLDIEAVLADNTFDRTVVIFRESLLSTIWGSVQAAIDEAVDGDVIRVGAGRYDERIIINKPLILRGATYDVDKNGYDVPANYAWDESVESIINNPEPALGTSQVVDIVSDDVVFEGFVVQSLNALPSSANDHLLRLDATTGTANDGEVEDDTLDNIVIRNNVIGPNTNLTSQNGTNGRMGLYFASPNYSNDERGITNTLVTGNKIIDSQGNGNNVFVWGAAESYNSPSNADYTNTVIEYNEISGSHRSGIEISGGVDGLIIRNNSIHSNSGFAGDDPNNLKYGNGILIIRMGSDKTSVTAMGSADLVIEDNQIYDNEKNGIYLGPINSGHSISGNAIYGNGWDAIRIDLDEAYHSGSAPVYDRISDISAGNNEIYDNNIGAQVVGTPTNGFVLDATNNWWGTFSSSEIAAKISDNVSYEPYCAVADCSLIYNKITEADSPLAGANMAIPTSTGATATSTPSVTFLSTATITVTDGGGESTVTIPEGVVITRADGENLDTTLLSSSSVDSASLAGLGTGVVAEGALQWGIENIGLEFDPAITISIFVGTDLNGQTLDIVRSTSGSDDWTNDGILQASCVVSDGLCTFETTKASYFAATSITPPPAPTSRRRGGTSSEIVFSEEETAVEETEEAVIPEATEELPEIVVEEEIPSIPVAEAEELLIPEEEPIPEEVTPSEEAAPRREALVFPPVEVIPEQGLASLLLATIGAIRESAWMSITVILCLLGLAVIGIREWGFTRKIKRQ